MANAHEGKTFYTDLKRYPEIDADGDCGAGYALVPVLDASTEFLPFFDIFGTMLKLCKNDFSGNVNKLQKKSKEISKAQTFKELLDYELNNGLAKKSDSACIAALWYKRGLQFIIAFIEQFLYAEDTKSGYELFTAAYEATLKKYHSWIVQKGILVVAKMIPQRSEVVKMLCYGDESLQSQLMADQKDYLKTMKPFADYLHNLIVDLGLDTEEKV